MRWWQVASGIVLLAYGACWFTGTPAQPHPVFAPGATLPRVIAHRGGAGMGPENTLPTFRQALQVHADVLEMDVRRTQDGVLVLMHDATVARTTDGTGRVDELTLQELAALDAGYRWESESETAHPYRGRGYRVPTFEEVAAEFSGTPMVIEIKSKHPSAPAELCQLLVEHSMEDSVLVAAFSTSTLDTFREVCTQVGTSAGMSEAASFVTLAGLRHQGQTSPSMQALQLPPSAQAMDVVTPHLIAAAHERGLAVDVWTINAREEMERFIDMGVDGIITDRPDILATLLEGLARKTLE